ncbi:MAG: histidinol-phosphatase [Treponema sp.]|nr:histidinol-phosphatase [Treponema sp.]
MKSQSLFSSMHTHTCFCDGKDDVETMCRTAYERKLYAIGFSAHAPIEKQIGSESHWNIKDERVNDYVAEVLSAKERWRGKLNVFLGYEADYIKNRRSPADDDIKKLNLDYIIGSVHYLFPENGARFFTVDGPIDEFERGLNEGYNGDAQALMHSYYDAILEMIAIGGFEILGHADLLKKNCNGKNYWTQETELSRQKEIARAAAGAGLVIEVNTGGLNRKKINDTYPSLSFLRIIREYDIPVIITSDAHCANHIDGCYEIALKTLILADFKEHIIFNGRLNGKVLWKKEKL